MDDAVRRALEQDRTIDITTTGRKTGKPHRIEIWFHNLDGRLYITGSPGRRDWYANLLAQPRFLFHLKYTTKADLPAEARAIREPGQRQEVFSSLLTRLGREEDLESWVKGSPLVEVVLWDS